ncbi:biotin--[acetyl-CoA-carboxylase] ligase [Nocardioides sp. KR10-350]|uniref:biotin--[acetyl-CoA-carboxylase] ligase n=1 Tax=Nocardioides cheoyonin TaxID=3156615 RepID=UPI0032B4011F
MRRPPLDAVRLAAVSGWDVEILPETPSTNAVVAERARQGAPEGLVVTTEHQTAGRGRLDRAWSTPARSALTVSALLRPDSVPAERWPWLPLMTGVAVADTLRGQGYAAGLKWPNDVLISGRKVCGILVERVDSPVGPAAVVGIGLNTSLAADELPVPTATSLALEKGAPVDRTELLHALLEQLTTSYAAWRERPQALTEAYLGLSVTVGRYVRAELPGGDLVGTATGIDASGRLEVVPDGGTDPVAVGAGDVVHLRGAPAPDGEVT